MAIGDNESKLVQEMISKPKHMLRVQMSINCIDLRIIRLVSRLSKPFGDDAINPVNIFIFDYIVHPAPLLWEKVYFCNLLAYL